MLIVDHQEMYKRECDDQSDVLKQKHVCMNHMLHYFWVFHSHGLSAAGDLSSVFTQQMCWCAQSLSWKCICILFVWQEHESAAGPGWELRAGPDLHHREDHFCFLPQQRGRAELCSQPAGGCLHAALQARPKLPGILFSNESILKRM